MLMLRIVIDVLIAIGVIFALAGTLGVMRMPDTFCRMQASTCVTTLGVIGVGLGALLYTIFFMGSAATAVKVLVICGLVLVTNRSGWRRRITGGTLMSEIIVVLNVLIILGMVVSAVMAVQFDKLLSSIIALGVTGIFAAAEFLLLHAPDVAISEAAVGAALSPLIFIVTLKKIRGGDDK